MSQDENSSKVETKKILLIGGIFALGLFLAVAVFGSILAMKYYSQDRDDSPEENLAMAFGEDTDEEAPALPESVRTNKPAPQESTKIVDRTKEPPACDNGGGCVGTLRDDLDEDGAGRNGRLPAPSASTEVENTPQEPPACDNGGGYVGTLKDKANRGGDSRKGRFYKKISLVDTSINAPVFAGLIPQNWQADVKSNWKIISTNYPVLELVYAVSDDKKAEILIFSPQAYIEDKTHQEKINFQNYTSLMPYHTAEQYLKKTLLKAQLTNPQAIKTFPPETNTIKMLNKLTSDKINRDKRLSDFIEQELRKLGRQRPFHTEYYPISPSACRKQYKCGNKYIEGSCVISAYKSISKSPDVKVGRRTYPGPSSELTYWEIPYTILFIAKDKASFDKYYKDYDFITANSQFTPQFYYAVQKASEYITYKVAEAGAKSSQASLEAFRSTVMNNYSSSTNGEAMSTNEKVMAMWDDYIKDEDSYRTSDGRTVKTSMFNETVAQDGDTFYVGKRSDIPSGFTELKKAYE